MSSKITDSIEKQKVQLAAFISRLEQLRAEVPSLKEAIAQVKGSISALEYVATLGLVEPQKDSDKAEDPAKVLQFPRAVDDTEPVE